MAKTTCGLCGAKMGTLMAVKTVDGYYVCSKCLNQIAKDDKASGIYSKSISICTIEEARNIKNTPRVPASQPAMIQKSSWQKAAEEAAATTIVGSTTFNDSKMELTISAGMIGKKRYSYSDILDFELLEDGISVATGGLGRAVVGGVLFGGAGAVVGGVTGKRKTREVCNSLRVKITFRGDNAGVQYIDVLNGKEKKDSRAYRSAYDEAQKIVSLLQIACDSAAQRAASYSAQPIVVQQVQSSSTVADEIMKFKQLLDMGAITQEEFEAEKSKLLGS